MARSTDRLSALLVYKKSRLQFYSERLETKKIQELLEAEDLTVHDLQEAHDAHAESTEKIKNILHRKQIPFEMVFRGDLRSPMTQNRLVITLGGDGTVLEAGQYIRSSPLLGVNTDSARSVGSLCATDCEGFEETMDAIAAGTMPYADIIRAGCILDGKELPYLALNEILIAHDCPAATSRYVIDLNGRHEIQKSSGIWVCAPAGSTGAAASSGGVVQTLEDRRLQFIVREPYFYGHETPQLLSGFVGHEESLKVSSRMGGGSIYVDGPHIRVPFSLGSKLEVHPRGLPLHLFTTARMEQRHDQGRRLSARF